jgi:hypothetical protein
MNQINVDDGVLPDDSLEMIAVEGIPLMSEGDNFAKEDEAVLDEISASDDKVSISAMLEIASSAASCLFILLSVFINS